MRDNKNNLLPNGLGFSCFTMSVDWYSSMNNNKAPTMIAFKLGRLVDVRDRSKQFMRLKYIYEELLSHREHMRKSDNIEVVESLFLRNRQ